MLKQGVMRKLQIIFIVGDTKKTGFKGNRLTEYWTGWKPLCPGETWKTDRQTCFCFSLPRERKNLSLPYKKSWPHTEATPWGGYSKRCRQKGVPTTLYWRQLWESNRGKWVRMWNPLEHLLFLPSHCKLPTAPTLSIKA